MMTLNFHTLIIGGGPSGSSCGIRLRQVGLDCCIVDKAQFPRVKLCGGLLSWKGQKNLESLLGASLCKDAISKSVRTQCDTLGLYHRSEELITVNFQDEIEKRHFAKNEDHRFCVLDRPTFDEYLVRHYQSLGGHLIEGDGLQSVDFDAKEARLVSGTVIRYKYLVACDGTNSHTLHLLRKHDPSFPTNGQKGLCVEMFVPREMVRAKGITIHFDVVPNTYAYVFPKGDQACVGLGKMPGETFDPNARLRDFARGLGIKNPEDYAVRGAMLPCYSPMLHPVWKDTVYFAGDAAGLVEMLTGEGISHAIASGLAAANSIAEGNAASYFRHIRKEHRVLESIASFQHRLENPRLMRYFYRHVGEKPSFVTYFYLNKIDRGDASCFFVMVVRHKFLKLRNWLRSKGGKM